MSIRHEENGLTLRLFSTADDATSYPAALRPYPYRSGWLAQTGGDSFADDSGPLPAGWLPDYPGADRPLVIYHKNCADGFAAALAAWLRFGDSADYVPRLYDEETPLPPISGRRVYILDFSFKPDQMARILAFAREVILLDHHKPAAAALSGLRCVCGKLHFDLGKSGAVLAWEHFHPGVPVPKLFRYVQDRDLFTWKLPESKSYLASLDTLAYNFGDWKAAMEQSDLEHDQFVQGGALLDRKMDRLVEAQAESAMPLLLNGNRGLMVNAHSLFRTELGNYLANQSGTFAAMWSVENDGRVKVSLRSVRGFPVDGMALSFHGAGHEHAASFYLSVEDLPKLLSGTLWAEDI